MIRQHFQIGRYGWEVSVFYAVDFCDTRAVLSRLRTIGCSGGKLLAARQNLAEKRKNTGFTYSNFSKRKSVMFIGLTSSAAEFMDSYDHEKGHLARHICQAFTIDPYGEEAQYLAGDIGRAMFEAARPLMCDRYRKHI